MTILNQAMLPKTSKMIDKPTEKLILIEQWTFLQENYYRSQVSWILGIQFLSTEFISGGAFLLQ